MEVLSLPEVAVDDKGFVDEVLVAEELFLVAGVVLFCVEVLLLPEVVEDVVFVVEVLVTDELLLVEGVLVFCAEVWEVLFVFWEVLVGDCDNSEVSPAVLSDEVVTPTPVPLVLQAEKQSTVVRHKTIANTFFIRSPR